jgi:hypothetical protein
LPTGFCERDHICACAAANINGATGLVLCDEFDQFWWADACIPWRLAEIPILKKQAAEQVLHLNYHAALNVIVGR